MRQKTGPFEEALVPLLRLLRLACGEFGTAYSITRKWSAPIEAGFFASIIPKTAEPATALQD